VSAHSASADSASAHGRSRRPDAGQLSQPDEDGGHHRGTARGLILTFAVVIALTAGVGVLLSRQTYRAPSGTQVARRLGTATVDGVSMPHVLLHFATYPSASGTADGVPIHPEGHSTWPAYGPTPYFEVPAHALVTVDVRQYDGGATITNPWFATVRGTVGDVMTVDGRMVHAIDPHQVAHTFTVQALPGGDRRFFLNVPLPDVGNHYSDHGTYRSVVFSFVSGPKGMYAWNCEFPCGQMVAGNGGSMGTLGYMSGYLHVV